MSMEGLPIVNELRAALVRLVQGDAFSWQRIGGSYDLLRRALVETVRGAHGKDPGPALDEIWGLLRRAEALEQVTRFHRLDPHYAGVAVDSAWLYRNACGLVATARTAIAAQQREGAALARWSATAGELLGLPGGAPTPGPSAPAGASTLELVEAAFGTLTEQGWRVQGARLWTVAWLPRDEPRTVPAGRSSDRRRAGRAGLPTGPSVRVPVAGCFDGTGFLADLCLLHLEGDGELLPHPETALQPLGTQLLGGLRAAWEPFGQSVCFTFGLHDASVPSWVPLEGTSLSGAAALGFELLRKGRGGSAGRLVIAHVGPDGALEPVGHEVEKMEAALAADVPSVVLAHDSQVPEVCIERFRQSGQDVVRARNLREVLARSASPPSTRSGGRRRWVAGAMAVSALVFATGARAVASRESHRCPPASTTAEIVVAGVWRTAEQDAFQQVLQDFCDRSGIRVDYRALTDDDMAEYLDFNPCDPPDVAMLAQPGLLRNLVEDGRVQPLGKKAVVERNKNYEATARSVGEVDGTPYGVYYKADNKSQWWFNVHRFREAGVQPPTTLDEMEEAAERLRAGGIPWLSIGGRDGWPITDLFENIYLVTAGPEKYDELARGDLPYTHGTVVESLEILRRLLDHHNLAGGPDGALGTDWGVAVLKVVAPGPGAAATTFGGHNVSGHASKQTRAIPGVDIDSFPFPDINRLGPAVVGGGDVAVAMTGKPQAQKLLAYLASPRAAMVWARQGGFITANRNVPPSVYPDKTTRRSATALTSGGTFRFDLSDQQPPSFGAKPEHGMWLRFQQFLKNPNNPEATAAALQADYMRAREVPPPGGRPRCTS